MYKKLPSKATILISLIIITLISIYFRKPLENLEALDILDGKILTQGAQEIKKHKIIIAGISRDNISDLAIMATTIEHLGAQFADYKVVIFENDSKDGTKEFFKSWSTNNPKVNYIFEDFNLKKRPSIKFLADIRNRYLEEINKNPDYNGFDILAIVDMDMKYGIDLRGIQHSFSVYQNWDAVCSNGISNSRGDMYDMFAFRNEEFPMSPIEDPQKYWNENVKAGQKPYLVNSPLVKVDSCFGGLAFYKRSYLKGCSYDSINGDCEHLPFHACIKKNGGRMFMNPSQVIRYSHYQK